ncbi:MarR family winged helix-turn-helix transcriptional regulator [Hoyosella altamirensis]|uniref:DNA-binding MarR family transcriptional regulator n=1 Tax=Hoyosella altamirensis TaxID=616997 RepID=A0A839RMF9_9ACTN|nr:MarR family transcriptional regulator [Hoyosella altamirensis]MBB3037121.1 DNA-binding MarR family transcriptional regulator [Hoyosella altamirensis]
MSTASRSANHAWEALLTAHATLMKRFAAEDVWRGLTMREYDVLYALAKCSDPQRLAELNDHVLLSQPALSRMVERLVERGLIERTRDPFDGRGVRLALTDEGRKVQHQVGGRHAVSVARALRNALTDDEMQELQKLCAKLAAYGKDAE